MGKKPAAIVAVAWYTREDFDAVRQLAHDGGGMHDTFDDWLNAAEKVVKLAALQGATVERVTVKADAFAAWLAAADVENDEQSRASYAHMLASAKNAAKH